MEIAAKTVFVMLYIGAVESAGRWLRPDQVTRMTDAQAQCIGECERQAWTQKSLVSRRHEIADRWYAVNTRESIRDDTMRNGLSPYFPNTRSWFRPCRFLRLC